MLLFFFTIPSQFGTIISLEKKREAAGRLQKIEGGTSWKITEMNI